MTTKFKNPMLAVSDIEKSKLFNKEVLGLRIIKAVCRRFPDNGLTVEETAHVPVKFVQGCIR